jgi:adenine-specific DNA-methyltransferase
LDEIFGRKNFIQASAWFKRVSPANDAAYFSTDHDYVFCVAKNSKYLKLNRLPREEKHNKAFSNPDNDPRGSWNSGTLTGNKTPEERPNLYYAIINPVTGENIFPPNGLTWKYSPERMQELISQKIIYWGRDGKSKSPRVKRFLFNAGDVVPRSIWLFDEVGHTQEA